MADWQDMGDGMARGPDGRDVPIALLPPTERLVSAAATPAPMGQPSAPPLSGAAAPLSAQSVLSKLDQPAIAAARGQGQLPIAQQSTTTQSAVPMSTLQPVMDRGTQRAEQQAGAVVKAGDERARIGEQQAMTAATAAYGGMVTAQAQAEEAAQRKEIARHSALVTSMQDDPEIQPDRFIRGMSTGQSIGTVILAAIEGAFRGMTGQAGQSGVLNILERRIDQDIAAQKEQIASGRIRKGNIISLLREQGMSEEAAEKGFRAIALAKSEQLVQAEIARLGAGGARPEAAALAEQIKAQREQANDELMLTLGTPRSSTTTVRAPAAAAGGGDGFSKMLAARKAYEEAGATPEQLAAYDKANGLTGAGLAPGGESETGRARREKNEARTDNEKTALGTLTLLDDLGKQLGLAQDPKSSGFREDPSNKDILSAKAGEDIATGFSFGFSDNPISATEGALVESFGRLQSMGVISPSEEVRFGTMIRDAKTQSQRAIALNAIRPIIEAKLNPRDKPDQGGAEAAGFRRVAR